MRRAEKQQAMQIEEAYHLNIPDEDLDKIRTVGDFIDYVKTRVAAPAPA